MLFFEKFNFVTFFGCFRPVAAKKSDFSKKGQTAPKWLFRGIFSENLRFRGPKNQKNPIWGAKWHLIGLIWKIDHFKNFHFWAKFFSDFSIFFPILYLFFFFFSLHIFTAYYHPEGVFKAFIRSNLSFWVLWPLICPFRPKGPACLKEEKCPPSENGSKISIFSKLPKIAQKPFIEVFFAANFVFEI